MEDATKALLIAGGVLIAILILTIGVILYNSYQNTANDYNVRLSVAKIQDFNSKFEVYNGRTDITVYEILTVYNFAQANPGIITGAIVEVIVNSEPNFFQRDSETLKLLEEKIIDENNFNENKIIYYKVEQIKYDEQSNQVIRIDFKKVHS